MGLRFRGKNTSGKEAFQAEIYIRMKKVCLTPQTLPARSIHMVFNPLYVGFFSFTSWKKVRITISEILLWKQKNYKLKICKTWK